MLGIRFHTHSAACFISDEIGAYNDQVADLCTIIGSPVKTLYSQLLETTALNGRIALIESFLLKSLAGSEKKSFRIDKVVNILKRIQRHSTATHLSTNAS